MANAKLRAFIRASIGYTADMQRKILDKQEPGVIYVDGKGVDIDVFVRDLRPPKPGQRGDIVLVTTLARLAGSRDVLRSKIAEILAKGATIVEASTGRTTASIDDAIAMVFDAADELAGDRKKHSPEAAKKYGAMGGRPVTARTDKAIALGPWRDLGMTAEEALGTPAMKGWSHNQAYRELGKRNTAKGVKIGRPRKS